MHIYIRPQSESPIYQQIVSQIKQQIASGELASGAALPSMRALAQELRISVITTKRAYEELEREGLILTRPGRGSFVAPVDREALAKSREGAISALLREAVREAREGGIPRKQVEEILDKIYKEE